MRGLDHTMALGRLRRPGSGLSAGILSRVAPLLGMVLSLGGCAWFDQATYSVANAFSSTGERLGAPWGGLGASGTDTSLTIARVRGMTADPAAPLLPEEGNVWPAEEAPRATLANPDAALRGIPTYQPNADRALDRSTDPMRTGVPARGAQNQLRGSSSPPPPPLQQPDLRQPAATQPPLPPTLPPPPARADGRTILTPQGPVTTSGGTSRVQTYTVPGGGSGLIQQDGGFTTISPSGGQPQTLPTPR